jgi:hypothetical protein
MNSKPRKTRKAALVYLLVITALFNTFTLRAQDDKTTTDIELKAGLHLVYDITQNEKGYQYIIDFTSVSDKGVVFNWKMTDPVNKEGKITITTKALDGATYLDFYPATKVFDGTDISMIFSKQVYSKLASFKTGDTVNFSCNACFRGVTTVDVKANTYEVQDKNSTLAEIGTLKFSSIYNNGDFEVLNNPKFPLIVYFKRGMTIELKSFSYTP